MANYQKFEIFSILVVIVNCNYISSGDNNEFLQVIKKQLIEDNDDYTETYFSSTKNNDVTSSPLFPLLAIEYDDSLDSKKPVVIMRLRKSSDINIFFDNENNNKTSVYEALSDSRKPPVMMRLEESSDGKAFLNDVDVDNNITVEHDALLNLRKHSVFPLRQQNSSDINNFFEDKENNEKDDEVDQYNLRHVFYKTKNPLETQSDVEYDRIYNLKNVKSRKFSDSVNREMPIIKSSSYKYTVPVHKLRPDPKYKAHFTEIRKRFREFTRKGDTDSKNEDKPSLYKHVLSADETNSEESIDVTDTAQMETIPHFKIIKSKTGNRRKGMGPRKIIEEESKDGIILVNLDNQPFPQFVLPADLRQYMHDTKEDLDGNFILNLE